MIYLFDKQLVCKYRQIIAITKELCWDGNGWYVGAFSQSGSVTGVTSWYHGGQIFIRTYLNVAGSVKEYCWDANGPWYTGSFHA